MSVTNERTYSPSGVKLSPSEKEVKIHLSYMGNACDDKAKLSNRNKLIYSCNIFHIIKK